MEKHLYRRAQNLTAVAGYEFFPKTRLESVGLSEHVTRWPPEPRGNGVTLVQRLVAAAPEKSLAPDAHGFMLVCTTATGRL